MSTVAPETPSSYNSINDALSSNEDFEIDSGKKPPRIPWGHESRHHHSSPSSNPSEDAFARDLRDYRAIRDNASSLTTTTTNAQRSALSDALSFADAETRERLKTIAPDLDEVRRILHAGTSSPSIGLGITVTRKDAPYILVPPAGTTSPDLSRTSCGWGSLPQQRGRRWRSTNQHPASIFGGTPAERASTAASTVACDIGEFHDREVLPGRRACSSSLGPPGSDLSNEHYNRRSPIF